MSKKYIWYLIVMAILGAAAGYGFRWFGLYDKAISMKENIRVEISNETDIVPIDHDVSWLGLRIKTFIGGEEKRAEADYIFQVEIPGLQGKFDLVLSRDERNYVLPLWPLSDPGEYRFLITTKDNVGSDPFRYTLNYPGITQKTGTYIISSGQSSISVEGIDLQSIDDAYQVVGDGIIKTFPDLSENGGILTEALTQGMNILVFRIGDNWYYTRIEV